MEAQTLEQKIAEAEKDLKEAKAEYRAEKESKSPDLSLYLQRVSNCEQLLHDLYEKEKRLHQEQQARETPAGNVRFLNRTEGMVRWKTEGWHSRTSAKLDILFAVCSQ